MSDGKLAKLAFVTIGQAPRHDLSASIEQSLDTGIDIRHAGVLDGLHREEIEQRFGARPDRPWLISRIRDGSTVTLDADAIGGALGTLIGRLDREGDADIIVLLCTGEFPALRTRRAWLVEPDRVVCNAVGGLVGDAQIGIIVPLPPQVEEARRKWAFLEPQPIFASASPYDTQPQSLIAAAGRLRDQGARALVLDCMAYALAHKQVLRDAGFDLPIIVSGSVVAGALAAFL